MKQTAFLKRETSAYGGSLMTTRAGRSHPRPLSTRTTMHLVLRSTKAVGPWSFRRPANEKKLDAILARFSRKYDVRILSMANVGNHLHFQIKLANRFTYRPFIRAITSAIAMAITGASRWSPSKSKFWDYRPFTRIIESFRAVLTFRDYIRVNELEGCGYSRGQARWLIVQTNRMPDTS